MAIWLLESVGVFPSILASLAAMTLSALWWARRSNERYRMKALVDMDHQSRELPDGSRVAGFLEGNDLKEYLYEDARTLYEVVKRGLRVSKNGPMLGYRQKQPDGSEPYVWISYSEVLERSENLAYGLRALGVKPGQETFVGIYSKNMPQWTISELATYANRSVVVALYDTLGRDALSHIVNLCGIEVVFCDSDERAMNLVKKKAECECLKALVMLDKFGEKLSAAAEDAQLSLYHIEEVEKFGRELSPKLPLELPKPKDVCTVSFTSGTTGTPKGVMLTHGNVIACTVQFRHLHHLTIDKDDVIMSFLPLAHMYERLTEMSAFIVGARVGYFRGDVLGLVDDIRALHPTTIALVPRILNRIYDKTIIEVKKSFIVWAIFSLAMAYKSWLLKRRIFRTDSVLDRVVFGKIRASLGGRLRLLMTGSAPIAENVSTFARGALGCVVLEGYGQTECVAGCTTSLDVDTRAGHVGIPLLCARLKLIDSPELGYFARDGAGEVCIRGPSVFKGYFKDEKTTAKTLDPEGWLHSGDIGRWNENGTLSIIDRKKHIFKLQQGEYVAPDKIENIYSRCQFVLQSFVYGESLKTCLVGIVVPDEEVLQKEVEIRLGIKDATLEELCENLEVKKLVLDEMIVVGKREGLFSFEQVKDIYLSPERFSLTNDLITPTLKNKRANMKKHFAAQLDQMYSQLK